MKKLIITILSLAMMFALVSCDGSTEPNIESSTAENTTALIVPEDVVHVVCGIADPDPTGMYKPFKDEYIAKFNALLLQKGYNFCMEFAYVDGDDYLSKLQNGAVDILYTGGFDTISDELLSNFEPLNLTDEERALFTQAQWDQVTQDGEEKLIPVWNPYNPYKMWTKDGQKDFISILDSLEGDKKLYFYGDMFSIYDLIGDSNYNCILIYDTEDNVFRSPFDEKYIPVLRKAREAYDNDHIIFPTTSDIPISAGYHAYVTSDWSVTKPEGYTETIVKRYATAGGGTGIGIGSKHKTEAKQLLNIFLTDEELTRTFFYGTADEPKDDAQIQSMAESIRIIPIFFGYTRFAGLYPDKTFDLMRPYDLDDPIRFIEEYTKPGINVRITEGNFDYSIYSDIIMKFTSYGEPFWTKDIPFDDVISKVNDELAAAGYFDWLDHVNKENNLTE
jgi:hypothetical protein